MNTQNFAAKSFSRRHLMFVPVTVATAAAAPSKQEPRLTIKSGIKAGSRYALAYP